MCITSLLNCVFQYFVLPIATFADIYIIYENSQSNQVVNLHSFMLHHYKKAHHGATGNFHSRYVHYNINAPVEN